MTEFRREGAARMADLPRIAPFRMVRDAGAGEGAGDGLTLDGYASVFNAETIINSWEGRFKERFLPGSMARSFRQQTPRIQFDHGQHPLIGSIPIAAFEAGFPREDTHPDLAPDGGAHVVARVFDNWLTEPVRAAIAAEAIDGMSIRFGVVKERWYWPDGRQVKNSDELEAELERTWFTNVPDDELLRRDIVESTVAEMGPVVWPAYKATSVGVRSLLDHMGSDGRQALVRELAAELRRLPDLTDLIAAPGARSAGGEENDAERQAVEASTSTTSRRQRADDDALRIRGIAPRREADHG